VELRAEDRSWHLTADLGVQQRISVVQADGEAQRRELVAKLEGVGGSRR
jgi:hypothetical protein